MATPEMPRDATERCLVCAPVGKDAFLLLESLRRQSIEAESYESVEALAASFEPSADAVILVAEEALVPKAIERLHNRVQQQPLWSEIPIILLTTSGQRTSEVGVRLAKRFGGLGNITMLERPLRVETLLSTVTSAIRARRRQYQMRDLWSQRERDTSALKEARDALEQRVRERTSELNNANLELRREVDERTRAEKVLRQLSQRVIQLQDEERKRIARELHDSVGQYLSAIAMNLTSLQDRPPSELPRRVQESLKYVENCVREVRTISHLLHPPLLDEIGLSSALEWYVNEFSRRGGIRVSLDISPDLGRMQPEAETAVFRVVQEALTNIHRHSGAQNASICIQNHGEMLRITISDNGRGISEEVLKRIAAGQSGVGVTGMKERVKQLGGECEIQSNQQGTTLHVELPIVPISSQTIEP